ncbi:Nuclear receptor 2C2-associated protein [Halotydeus destructor]|nr:Nuclear receptor 2C2-associated protein [Halotydeus destructor]
MNTTSSHPRMYDATSGGGLGSPSPTRYKMNGSSSARNNHQSTVRISTMSPGGFNRTLGSTNSKPLLDFSTISNGFTPASGLDRKGFSRLPLEANSSLHSEYEYNGIHEMLASLALMCLLSLLMAFLALFFLQRTGPSVSLTGDEGSNLLDSKLNKNNLNSAISQTRIVLNAKEYAKVYQISVALSTLTISLNLCCLFVCCIQFLSAVKLLKTPQGKKRVSSTLDAKLFGKKCLVDGRDDTCWNSDEGEQQWVVIKFKKPVNVNEVQVQFQGGFSSRSLKLTVLDDASCEHSNATIHPSDVNSLQTFPVECQSVSSVKLTFEDPCDMFGRIVIYRLNFNGSES